MYAVSPFFGSQIALCTGSSYTAAAMVGSTPLKFFMLGEYLGAERKGEDVSLLGGLHVRCRNKTIVFCSMRAHPAAAARAERTVRAQGAANAPRPRRERAANAR